MPANLSPDYFEAEKEYKAAKSLEEKLAALQRMLSVIPKHKGTEKLQGEIKRRISQLKEKQESQSKKKGPSFRVKPEGAGQICLVGAPNSGKSSLLAALTKAEPEIADYPFTTREPIPGMVPYMDIQIQLVDLPPISREHCESFVFDNIRGSDGVLLFLDLTAQYPVEDLKDVIQILEEKRIHLIAPGEEPDEHLTGDIFIRALLVINKWDEDPDGELVYIVEEMLDVELPGIKISAEQGFGFEELTRSLFDLLHVIRVYSKQPGKGPDRDAPFTAPMGVTVQEFAGLVHKDFAKGLKSARIWGSAKFDGQVVQRDHVLQDGDVVELSL